MASYTFHFPADLAGADVTVTDVKGGTVTTGTLDGAATFTTALAEGTYTGVAKRGSHSFSTAADGTSTDPDDTEIARQIGTPGSATQAALSATLGWTMPAPNGSDDTASIQAMLDAVPDGATVRFREGTYKVPNGGLTTSKKLRIFGSGAGTHEGGGTRIECSSATATLLTLTSPGCTITDLALVNTSGTRPTAGAGLYATDFDWGRVNRVLIDGFWNNAQFDSGYYYTLSDSAFLNPRNYGIWLRNTASGQFDHGDHGIVNCVITKYGDTTPGGTAVRWESGGGLRFTASKINGGTQPGYTSTSKFDYGIDLNLADGATVDLMVTGNSIENCTTSAVTVRNQSGSGIFKNVIVSGNEIGYCGSGVQVIGRGNGQIGAAIISANVFTQMTVNAIYAAYADGITIGPNHHFQPAAASPAVLLGNGCNDANVSPQTIQGDGFIFQDDTPITNQSESSSKALIKHEYQRQIAGVTSTSTYVTLYRFAFSKWTAGSIEVSLAGNAGGVGGYFSTVRRTFITDANRAFTVATLGTDSHVYAAGTAAPPDIFFDTTSVTGEIQVKVRLNSVASASALYGRATVKIEGLVYQARRGA